MDSLFTLLQRHRPRRTNNIIISLFLITTSFWIFITFHGFQLNGDITFANGFLPYNNKQHQTPHDNVLKFLQEERNVSQLYATLKDPYTDMELLEYDRTHVKYIYPEVIDSLYNSTDLDNDVDWSKLAYVLYATSAAHMCNAMMILAELRNFGTRAELVILVNDQFLNATAFPREYMMLEKYQKEYNVTLKATPLLQRGGDSVNIWLSSYTKLLVFNQTEYDRVIYMDSDAILLKSHLDELFFIPPCQMAAPPAYWHMHDSFDKESVRNEFPTERFGFQPLTKAGRQRKIDTWIEENIEPFKDPQGTIPTSHKSLQDDWETEHQFYNRRINNKNFQTNTYNNLPNYPPFHYFRITNIMMVIQPSEELFERVQYALDHKGKDEYDMELVDKMFHLPTMLKKQQNNSYINKPTIKFDERLTELPEVILLPYQRYATLSQQMNSKDTHWWWAADAHEQVFAHFRLPTASGKPAYYEIDDDEHPYDTVFNQVKYYHFSDAPIPKPWWKQDPKADYMRNKMRCDKYEGFHSEDIPTPNHKTRDCQGGVHWDYAHALFRSTRFAVCGLDVVVPTKNTYYEVIN